MVIRKMPRMQLRLLENFLPRETKINNEIFVYVMRFFIWSVENDSENK